jgi:HSP20 family protein
MANDDFIRLMHTLFLPAAGTYRDVDWRPATDVYRTRRGWVVKMELAGVRPEDINITAAGRRLTVWGRRRDCFAEEGHSCYSMEICYSQFERAVELPCDLELAHITTDYQYGMLLVRIETEADQ